MVPPQAPAPSPDANEELRSRLRGLTRLLDVTRLVAQEIDLNAILETIACEASRALACDRASLYQFDPETNELFTRVATELEIDEIRHSLDNGVTGYVARNREITNVSEPENDPRWNADIDRKTGYQTRNLLAAPLTSPRDDTLLGVLLALNKHEGSFDSFDEELIEAFSQHAAAALDRARLVEELRQQQATQASLMIARDVQRGFMPTDMPKVADYDIAFWWYPHEAVGGDYCDVIPLDDGRVLLVMADVSGHGLGPSLIMASVRAALRALLQDHHSPDDLLGALNHSLGADFKHGNFVTMIVAALTPETHRIEFANAGHAPALHYRMSEDRFAPLESTGVPLGVIFDLNYSAGPEFDLAPGDVLLLCTDGIVEAIDADGQPLASRDSRKSSAAIETPAPRPSSSKSAKPSAPSTPATPQPTI